MKNILLFLFSMAFGILANGQCQMNPTINSVTCCGANNGSIDIIAFGGTAPYNIAWNGGLGTVSPAGNEINSNFGNYIISNLPAGTYIVTLTDANGCQTQDLIIITEPLCLVASVTLTNCLCYGDQTGSITITSAGGVAAYDVSWWGPVNGSISGWLPNSPLVVGSLPAGIYNVTVTDAAGCSTSQITVISEPPPLTVTGITSNNGIDITVGGGTPPYTYAWSTGATTEDLTNLMPGTYMVTVTDANGCTLTDSFTVQNADLLTISALDLEIYPNPACDKLTLKMKHSNNVPFYITDNIGRTVIKGRSEFDLTEIRIDYLKSGIYLLHMDNVTLTFVKE